MKCIERTRCRGCAPIWPTVAAVLEGRADEYRTRHVRDERRRVEMRGADEVSSRATVLERTLDDMELTDDKTADRDNSPLSRAFRESVFVVPDTEPTWPTRTIRSRFISRKLASARSSSCCVWTPLRGEFFFRRTFSIAPSAGPL